MNTDTRALAMLIDGDNAQPSLVEYILAETAKYGVVTTRRVYGDWTTPQMNGWKGSLQTYAVLPMQQFRYTVGKNATDSALIIDAMDLLHAGALDGFCIVSSDSDYTRLATRVREQGLFVMGIGKSETPRAFVNACEVFVYTENLTPHHQRKANETKHDPKAWIPMMERAIEMGIQDDGWAQLGVVGSHLRQLDPAFDPRSYGQKQLSLLIKSQPKRFQVEQPRSSGGAVQVRMK